MTPNEKTPDFPGARPPLGPFRRAVVRGLAILLPPLLTIVIFFWVGTTVNTYMLAPLESAVRWGLAAKPARRGRRRAGGGAVSPDGRQEVCPALRLPIGKRQTRQRPDANDRPE